MKVQINHHFQVPQIHHQRKCHPHKIQEAQFLHSYHCTLQIEFFQQYFVGSSLDLIFVWILL